jgi:hypothetical protein
MNFGKVSDVVPSWRQELSFVIGRLADIYSHLRLLGSAKNPSGISYRFALTLFYG